MLYPPCGFALFYVLGALTFAIPDSFGGPAAFSEDGNSVYLTGSAIPPGGVLHVNLTTFATTTGSVLACLPRSLPFARGRTGCFL